MANIFEINRPNNKITLGTTGTTINVASHTASLLLSLDASKDLESVSDLTLWVAGTANQIAVANDGDGTITLSTPQNIHTGASPAFTALTLLETCTAAAGLSTLRVTGLQTDGTAMTGTLRGAYIDVSNGALAATGTIRALELKARTEAPGDTGNDVAVLEGLSISADSKGHSVTAMRAAEFILDGSVGGTITEAVGLRIANNLQANKATTSYGLQIYRDSFDYTADIQLSNGATISNSTAGEINIGSATLISTIAAENLIERSGTASYDFDVSDFTADAAWHDLDLSGILPVGTYAFLVAIVTQCDAAGERFVLIKKGNSAYENKFQTRSQIANVKNDGYGIVFCDSNRKCEYLLDVATWALLNIVIIGWWT